MPRVKVTEYKGFFIMHGPLFKRIETDEGPYTFRSLKEAKEYIDNNMIKKDEKPDKKVDELLMKVQEEQMKDYPEIYNKNNE